MNKKEALALCEKHGEFYIHYRKLREGGTTYLQGTTEFDVTQDKYVAARLAKENLKEADDKHILVFSRSSDKFRYIPVANIKRITSLNYELDQTSKRK